MNILNEGKKGGGRVLSEQNRLTFFFQSEEKQKVKFFSKKERGRGVFLRVKGKRRFLFTGPNPQNQSRVPRKILIGPLFLLML